MEISHCSLRIRILSADVRSGLRYRHGKECGQRRLLEITNTLYAYNALVFLSGTIIEIVVKLMCL